MKRILLATAAVAVLSVGAPAAFAECKVVNAAKDKIIVSDPERRSAFTGPVRREIRKLRNAARLLRLYGQDEACQAVAKAIDNIIDDPRKASRARMRHEAAMEESKLSSEERERLQMMAAMPITKSKGRTLIDNILGADVRGAKNENIGEISDVVLESSGKPTYVLVAFGGFLGMGEEEAAIPFEMLRVSPDREVYYVNMTEEQLENAPKFRRRDIAWLEDDGKRRANDTYYKSFMVKR